MHKRIGLVVIVVIGFVLASVVVILQRTEVKKSADNEVVEKGIDIVVPDIPPDHITPIVETTVDGTVLTISSTTDRLTIGQEDMISVILTERPATAVDISVVYDPSVLKVIEVTNGSVFSRVIRKEIEEGRVSYSATVNPALASEVPVGMVFTMKVKPLSEGKVSLSFDPKETITALAGRNTLSSVQNAIYTIEKL